MRVTIRLPHLDTSVEVNLVPTDTPITALKKLKLNDGTDLSGLSWDDACMKLRALNLAPTDILCELAEEGSEFVVEVTPRLEAGHELQKQGLPITTSGLADCVGDLDKLSLYLKAGIDPAPAVLSICQHEPSKNEVDGLNIIFENNPRIVDTKDPEGQTLLMLACKNGYSNLVEVLISNKANMFLRSSEGMTALLYAAKAQNSDIVKMLIDNASTVINSRTSSGFTALFFACMTGDLATAKVLIEKGATLTAKTNEGLTALMLACQSKSASVVKYLIEQHVNVNVKSTEYKTALHYAVQAESEEIVTILVNAGATVSADEKEYVSSVTKIPEQTPARTQPREQTPPPETIATSDVAVSVEDPQERSDGNSIQPFKAAIAPNRDQDKVGCCCIC